MDRLFFIRITAVLVLLLSPFVNAVVLYIDPGTGSLLFQIISAIVLAILFYFSLLKKFIKKMFNKIKSLFFK